MSNPGVLFKSKGISSIGTGGLDSWNNTLVYEDMNATTGGIARQTAVGTSYVNLYEYNGSGLFKGFLVMTQTLSDWTFQIEVDGNEIFNTSGLNMGDVLDTAIYGFGDLDPFWCGIRRSGNKIEFMVPDDKAIFFESNITIKAKNTGNKKFLAGLTCLTKES